MRSQLHSQDVAVALADADRIQRDTLRESFLDFVWLRVQERSSTAITSGCVVGTP